MRARDTAEQPAADFPAHAAGTTKKRKAARQSSNPLAAADPVMLLGIFVCIFVALAYFMHDTPLLTVLLWAILVFGVILGLLVVFFFRPIVKMATS